MNTFDTSSFIQKTMSDLGAIGVGQPGAINLIPSMPGMGILGSIQGECQTLEAQAPIKTQTVQLEQIQGDGVGLGAKKTLEAGDAQVFVVDAGGASMTAGQIEDLVEFVGKARTGASVWVVGGDTDAIARQLEGNVSRFENSFRSLRDNRNAANGTVQGSKPKM